MLRGQIQLCPEEQGLHHANTTFEGAVFMCTIQSTKAGLTPAQLLTERGPV